MRHHDFARDPARECEHRPWVEYDSINAGHVIHPNGSLVASLDRGFLGAATRAALEIGYT